MNLYLYWRPCLFLTWKISSDVLLNTDSSWMCVIYHVFIILSVLVIHYNDVPFTIECVICSDRTLFVFSIKSDVSCQYLTFSQPPAATSSLPCAHTERGSLEAAWWSLLSVQSAAGLPTLIENLQMMPLYLGCSVHSCWPRSTMGCQSRALRAETARWRWTFKFSPANKDYVSRLLNAPETVQDEHNLTLKWIKTAGIYI